MAYEVKEKEDVMLCSEMSAADSHRDINSRLYKCWTEDCMAFFGTQLWTDSIGSI